MPTRPCPTKRYLIAAVQDALAERLDTRADVQEAPAVRQPRLHGQRQALPGRQGRQPLGAPATGSTRSNRRNPGLRELDPRGGMAGYFWVTPPPTPRAPMAPLDRRRPGHRQAPRPRAGVEKPKQPIALAPLGREVRPRNQTKIKFGTSPHPSSAPSYQFNSPTSPTGTPPCKSRLIGLGHMGAPWPSTCTRPATASRPSTLSPDACAQVKAQGLQVATSAQDTRTRAPRPSSACCP